MAVIKHDEIFDSKGFNDALKECNKNVSDFSKTLDDLLSTVKGRTKETSSALGELAKKAGSFNVASPDAADGLKKLNTVIDDNIQHLNELKAVEKGVAQIRDFSTASVKELRAEYKGLKAQYEALDPTQKDYADRVKLIATRLNDLLPKIGSFSEEVKKSKQQTLIASDTYRGMNAELTQLRNQLKDMPNAFNKLTGEINKDNKAAVEMQQRIDVLAKTLLAADQQLSVHTRNVGNYASAFNPLNNSVSQIVRELPSAAIGLQTFFLAISNNIGPLQDAIKQTAAANAQLIAQGQRATPVFSQFAGALFSWNTLITVGITAVTIFGSKIADWLKHVFDSKKAFDLAKISAEEYKKSIQEITEASIKNSTQEVTRFEILKKILTDTHEPIAIRNKALHEYNAIADEANKIDVKSINNLQIINDKIDTQIELIKERGLARAAESIIAQRSEEYLLALEKEKTKAAEDYKAERKAGLVVTQNVKGGDLAKNYVSAIEEAGEIERRAVNTEAVKTAKAKLDASLKAGTGLIEKGGFGGTKQGEDKALKEQEKANKDAERAEEKRLKALIESTHKREDVIGKGAELEIKQEELRFAKGEIDELQFQTNRLNIIKDAVKKQIDLENSLGKHKDESRIEGFSTKRTQAELEYTKFFQHQQEERSKLAAQSTQDVTKFIDDESAKRIAKQEAYNKVIQEADENLLKRKVEAEDRAFALEEARRGRSFNAEVAHLKRLLVLYKDDADKMAQIQQQLDLLIADKEKQIRDAIIEFTIQAANAGLQVISEQSRAGSEARIAQLQREKDTEIKLAGNNAAAKEKIEADYNKKIAAEKARQAKADKAFALFQIAINVAAAIAKHLATPFLIPFDIAMGALQAAVVAARPIPAFKKGTKSAPKGLAIVNEQGWELVERNGRMYVAKGFGPTLVNLKGGETIHTHEQSKKIIEQSHKAQEAENILRSIAQMNRAGSELQKGKQAESVAMMAKAMQQGGGITEAAMQKVMSNALKEIPIHQTIWDERGIRERTKKVNETVTYLNKRFGD